MMCVKFVMWRKTLFNSMKALLSSFFVIFVFFALNFHLNFTTHFHSDSFNNETIYENSTLIDHLLSSETVKLWLHVSIYYKFF